MNQKVVTKIFIIEPTGDKYFDKTIVLAVLDQSVTFDFQLGLD